MPNRIFAVLSFLSLAAFATPAAAFEVAQEGSWTLHVGGLARLGWEVTADDAGAEQRPYLQSARLVAGVDHADLGNGFIQIDAASGEARLLDAFVHLRPVGDEIAIRVGVYRLPTTLDFLVGIPAIPFRNRSLIVSRTHPRLLGAELFSDLDFGEFDLVWRVGFFEATGAERLLLPDGRGNFLSAHVGPKWDWGLSLHLSYLGLVVGDNDLIPDPEFADEPEPPFIQPVTDPHVIDVGIAYRDAIWDLTLEGLVLPNEADQSDVLDWGAYAHVTRNMPIGRFRWAPGLRYGVLSDDEVLTHRVTVGASFFFAGHNLKLMPNYELIIDDGELAHVGSATLQAAF